MQIELHYCNTTGYNIKVVIMGSFDSIAIQYRAETVLKGPAAGDGRGARLARLSKHSAPAAAISALFDSI